MGDLTCSRRDEDVDGGGLRVGRRARVVARVGDHHVVDDEPAVRLRTWIKKEDSMTYMYQMSTVSDCTANDGPPMILWCQDWSTRLWHLRIINSLHPDANICIHSPGSVFMEMRLTLS